MPIFTSKGVPDPLVQASSNILNSTPKYAPGDDVVVKEGPNAGMDGRVVGSRSAGYTDVQLIQGRQITISNDFIGPHAGMLNEADEKEDDNNGKPLDFKGKKKKKKSKKDFFKKNDDEDDDAEDSADDDDDKDEKDDDGPEEEDGLPKKAKKKSKAGGKGEEIEINPKLGEQIQDLNRKANIIQSGRAMSIMRGFLSNR
jgi:hypothetical protein